MKGIGGNIRTVNFDLINTWHIETKIEWHDNIPEQGILCRVADDKELLEEIDKFDIIYQYDAKKEFPFRVDNTLGWKFAIPVKPNDSIILNHT